MWLAGPMFERDVGVVWGVLERNQIKPIWRSSTEAIYVYLIEDGRQGAERLDIGILPTQQNGNPEVVEDHFL